MTDKGFRVRRNAAFAVLSVVSATTACKNDLNLDIQIATLGEAHAPSHTGIFGYTMDDTDVAALLAWQVNPGEVYPAAVSPAQEV